jgi:hypothetical protein
MRRNNMASDSSERIDDYCREKYGHTNWGYLSTYEDHELEHAQKCGSDYVVEGGIVYWINPDEEDE